MSFAAVTAATAVAGVGLGAYNTFAGGGGEGGEGGGAGGVPLIWPEFREAPLFPWAEEGGALYDVSDYAQDNLARIRRGEFPDYFENARESFRENLTRPVERFYEGDPGRRTGALQKAVEVGSITGLGPANVAAGVQQQLFEYANRENQIDEYLTKLGFDVMQQGAFAFPQMIQQLPLSKPGAFISPFQPSVPINQGNPLVNAFTGAAGQVLGQFAGNTLSSGLSGLFGQQTQTDPVQQSFNYSPAQVASSANTYTPTYQQGAAAGRPVSLL